MNPPAGVGGLGEKTQDRRWEESGQRTGFSAERADEKGATLMGGEGGKEGTGQVGRLWGVTPDPPSFSMEGHSTPSQGEHLSTHSRN